MITIRHAANRGWLDGRHAVSFGVHHDPVHNRFRTLGVMDEGRVALLLISNRLAAL